MTHTNPIALRPAPIVALRHGHRWDQQANKRQLAGMHILTQGSRTDLTSWQFRLNPLPDSTRRVPLLLGTLRSASRTASINSAAIANLKHAALSLSAALQRTSDAFPHLNAVVKIACQLNRKREWRRLSPRQAAMLIAREPKKLDDLEKDLMARHEKACPTVIDLWILQRISGQSVAGDRFITPRA